MDEGEKKEEGGKERITAYQIKNDDKRDKEKGKLFKYYRRMKK